ncbi:unnamed protein product [Lactuca saligna]|uniref:Uncharacterized protein n=1 Tax=Lactuca saligna TaxID=75948 RepID=A0AA35ZLD7_LACSI|nr:unnamed protein product [Lactuca saligna]
MKSYEDVKRVVYINGRPFVLREVERPFSNLEYTGINRDRVERMEGRLKEDIFSEAARWSNGGSMGSSHTRLCQNTTTGNLRTNSIGTISVCGSNAIDNMLNTEEALLRGEYIIIRNLIRVLEGDVEGKQQVDKVIEKCASRHNLQRAVHIYKSSPNNNINFYDWMKARPELYTIIRRLLRRDPMGALGYANIKPLNKISTPNNDGHPCAMEIVVVL